MNDALENNPKWIRIIAVLRSGKRSDGELSFINMTIGDVDEVYNGW